MKIWGRLRNKATMYVCDKKKDNLHGMKMGGPRSLEIAAAPLPFPWRAGMASAGVIPREPPRIIP